MSRLEVETSTDEVLDTSSEHWSFYLRSKDLFGGDELVVLALKDSETFSSAILEEVVRLTEVLEGIDGVRRVDSIASVPTIRSRNDGSLALDSALKAAGGGSLPRQELLALLLRDRIAPSSLMSDDGRLVALNVLLDSSLERPGEQVVSDIVSTSDWPRKLVSGVPVFRTEINLHTAREVASFAVATVLIIGILLRFLCGSAMLALVPLLVGGVAAVSILGGMGFFGISLSLSTMILPSIHLALGCAYAVHFVFAIGRCSGTGSRVLAAEEVSLSVALSGLTTSIGFIAIAFVPIEALRQVGVLGALGTIVATLAALSLAPSILAGSSSETSSGLGRVWSEGVLGRLILSAEGSPALVCVLGLGLGVLGAAALPSLSLETDATKWFAPGSVVRSNYEEIRRSLSGISPVNIVIDTVPGKSIATAEVMEKLVQFSDYLRDLEDVGKVLSIADPVMSVHDVFSPGDDRLTSSEQVAQYLLLLNSTEQIWDFVDSEYRSANVVLRVNDNGSDHLLETSRLAEEWWRVNGLRGYSARSTGIMYEFARAEQAIAHGQVTGVIFATGCIAVLLLLIFRSWSLACAALLANAVPIAVGFGGMAAVGLPLDAGTVLAANLALGIAVDDTIHFCSVYHNSEDLRETISRVLPALATTTLALGAGFFVLGFSQFAFTRNLGLLTSLVLLLCFAADLLLLPALLSFRRRAAKNKR